MGLKERVAELAGEPEVIEQAIEGLGTVRVRRLPAVAAMEMLRRGVEFTAGRFAYCVVDEAGIPIFTEEEVKGMEWRVFGEINAIVNGHNSLIARAEVAEGK